MFTVVTMLAVTLVAAIAAAASFQHQYELAIRHGQAHWVAGLQPLSVDGMIASATMVIWYAARHGYPRPWGAWLVLIAGVAATAVANLAADARAGWHWLGPAISVWPALAFVAAYEMAVWLVRKRQDSRQAAPAALTHFGRRSRLTPWTRRSARCWPPRRPVIRCPDGSSKRGLA